MNETEKTDALEWQIADQSERRIGWFIKFDQSGLLRSSSGSAMNRVPDGFITSFEFQA